MFSSLRRHAEENDQTEEVNRSASPRRIAMNINRLERELVEALGVLLAQKESLVDELENLPIDETNSVSRRESLQSEIAKVGSEMETLRSGKIAEYIAMDGSIGTRHLEDLEKMKKAAMPYTKLKVSYGIDLRLFTSKVTISLISIVLSNRICLSRTFRLQWNLASLALSVS
jgi:hypothetical protein